MTHICILYSIPHIYYLRFPLLLTITLGTDLPHENNSLFVGIDPHAEITRLFTNTEMFYPPDSISFENMKKSGVVAFNEWYSIYHMNTFVFAFTSFVSSIIDVDDDDVYIFVCY